MNDLVNNYEVNKRKLLSMIGFAKKSGNLIYKTENILKDIQGKKRVKFVIIVKDCSENQSKKIKFKCENNGVDYYEILTRAELSKILGTNESVCIGVTDLNFSNTIKNLIIKLNYENGG